MQKLFHLELTNLCTLKCPGCHRTQLKNEGIKWENHSIALDDLKQFIDIDISGKQINLCGTYGDALYHPDLINIVKWIKEQGACIQLTTNGGHKSKEFWASLAEQLDNDDEVIFSIDGTPDNFTEYRINGDWKTTLNGIHAIAASPAKMSWKYIVFNYNENDIAATDELAYSLGFDSFSTHLSNRYTDEFNLKYMPSEEYINTEELEARDKVMANVDTAFTPKCQGESPAFNYYISAEGYFTPCCLLADKRFYYDTKFCNEAFNIRNTTFSKIMEMTEEFYKFGNPTDGCRFFCGS